MSTPDAVIIVAPGSNSYISGTNQYDVVIATTSNIQGFAFGYSNPYLRITSNGFVGIGVSNPSSMLQVAGSVLPSSDSVYDLGSSNLRWKTLYIASNTLDIAGTKLKVDSTGSLLVTNSNGSNASITAGQLYIGAGSNLVSLQVDSSNNLQLYTATVSNGQVVTSSNSSSVGGGGGDTWAFSNNIIYTYSNVSIGTSNSTESLQSAGKMYSQAQHLGNSNDSTTVPSFSWKEDSNTGMFHASNDAIGFATNGVERIRITDIGNVGIGLPNPVYGLDIGTGDVAIRYGGNTADAGGSAYFGISQLPSYTPMSSVKGVLVNADSATSNLQGGLALSTRNNVNVLTERMRITTLGNVGIGTTNPLYLMDINGGDVTIRNGGNSVDAGGSVLFGISAYPTFTPMASIKGVLEGAVTASSNLVGGLTFFTRSNNLALSERMRITSLGNVGLNTSNPLSILTVNNVVVDNSGFNFSTAPCTITIPTPTNSNVLNDSLPVLHLARQGRSGSCFGARASFHLSRFANSGLSSCTRLDMVMANGFFDSNYVMTMRSDGLVGIATSNPASILSVAGNATIGAAYSNVAAPSNSLILQGTLGIGTSNPATSNALQVVGNTVFSGITSFNSNYVNMNVPVSSIGSNYPLMDYSAGYPQQFPPSYIIRSNNGIQFSTDNPWNDPTEGSIYFTGTQNNYIIGVPSGTANVTSAYQATYTLEGWVKFDGTMPTVIPGYTSKAVTPIFGFTSQTNINNYDMMLVAVASNQQYRLEMVIMNEWTANRRYQLLNVGTSSTYLASNTWYHVAYSYDASTLNVRTYINGQIQQLSLDTANVYFPTFSDSNTAANVQRLVWQGNSLTIGQLVSGNFKGWMTHVKYTQNNPFVYGTSATSNFLPSSPYIPNTSDGKTVVFLRVPLQNKTVYKNIINAQDTIKAITGPTTNIVLNIDQFGSTLPNIGNSNIPTYIPGALSFSNSYINNGYIHLPLQTVGATFVAKVLFTDSNPTWSNQTLFTYQLTSNETSNAITMFRSNANVIGFGIYDNSNLALSNLVTGSFCNTTPSVIVGRYDPTSNSGMLSLFINGGLISTLSNVATKANTNITDTIYPFTYIGVNSNLTNYTNMLLENFTVYNRPLTDPEIIDLSAVVQTPGTSFNGNSLEAGINGTRAGLIVKGDGAVQVNGPIQGLANTSFVPVDASSNSIHLSGYMRDFIPCTPFSPYIGAYNKNTGSMYFNGSDNYLAFSSNVGLHFNWWTSNLTIESWIYLLATPLTNGCLISHRNLTGSNWWGFGLNTSRAAVFTYVNTGNTVNTISSTVSLALNTWHHIAMTLSNTTIRLWVNGIANGSGTISGTPKTSNSDPVVIGANNNGNFFHMADLRIVRGALIYTSNFASPITPLTIATAGNTTLLVQAQQQPGRIQINKLGGTNIVQSYPPSSFTTYSNNFHTAYGAGTYITRASSETTAAWYAFANGSNAWQSSSNAYSNAIYIGSNSITDALGVSYAGEWIQLYTPCLINPTSFSIQTITGTSNQAPSTFTLLGSRDSGYTWAPIFQRSNLSWTSDTQIIPIQTDKAYNSFVLVSSVLVSNSNNAVALRDFSIYGTQEGITINNDGYVGIGVTRPAYPLEVAGGVCVVGDFNFTGNLKQGGNSNIGINNTTPAYTLDVAGDVQFQSNIITPCNSQTIFYSSNLVIKNPSSNIIGSVRVNIDGSGPGNANNQQMLLGVDGPYLNQVGYIDTSFAGLAVNVPLTFRINSNEMMRVTPNSIGIGTSNPTANLHVATTSNPLSQIYLDASNMRSVIQTWNAGSNKSTLLIGANTGWDQNSNIVIFNNSNVGWGIQMGNTNDQFQIFRATTSNTVANMLTLTTTGALSFGGGASFGTSYSNATIPTNSIIIQGGLGVGLSNPAYSLDVVGGARINAALSSNTNKLLTLLDLASNDAVTTACNFYGFGVNSNILRYQVPAGSNNAHIFYNGTTEVARLSNVSLAVGTSNPLAILHINNTACNNIAYFTGSNTGALVLGTATQAGFMTGVTKSGDTFVIGNSNNTLETGGLVLGVYSATAKGIRIDGPTGFVGVGKSNPTVPLDVQGNVNINGVLTVNSYVTSNMTVNAYGQGVAIGSTYCNVAAPSNGLIVQGNVGFGLSNPGYPLDIVGATLHRNGNSNNSFGLSHILFGYSSNASHMHSIKTRHNGGANDTNNAIDLYVWQTTDGVGVVGTKHAMSVTSVGVGILGLSNPSYALDVSGTGRVNQANSLNNKLLVLWDGGTTDAVATACNFVGLGVNANVFRYQTNSTSTSHVFYAGPTELARFTGAGNLGIGLTNPGGRLGVAGGASIGATYAATAPPTNGMIVQGNLGIGNTNPLASAHITQAATGALHINGTVFTGNATTTDGMLIALGVNGANNRQLWFMDGANAASSTSSVAVRIVHNTTQATIDAVTTNGSTQKQINVGSTTGGVQLLGNVGIGTSNPGGSLAVAGGQTIGNAYSNVAPPTNGLIVQGTVGIGLSNPNAAFTLDVTGGVINTSNLITRAFTASNATFTGNVSMNSFTYCNVVVSYYATGQTIGSNYSNVPVPANGLIVQGNVGIGTSNPINALQVAGGAVVGTDYSNVTAPTNGLSIQGNLAVGKSNPPSGYVADINGTVRINTANAANNKLLVLYDINSNEAVATGSNFYGFGINSGALRYQSQQNHVFYALSTELARITTTGRLGIGNSNPQGNIHVTSNSAYLILDGNGSGITSWAALALSNGFGLANLGIAATTGNFNANAVAGDTILRNLANTGRIMMVAGPLTTVTPGITITSNNSVGIGKVNPAPLYSMDVQGSVRVNAALAGTNKVFVLWDGNSNDAVSTACNFMGLGVNNGVLRYQAPASNNHVFYVMNNEVVRFNNLGYVGIGTSNPLSILHTSGCNSQFILDAAGSNFVSMQWSNAYGTTTLGFAASNNNYIIGTRGGDFSILNTVPTGRIFVSTNSNYAGITINSNDFVGINTSNPLSILHMSGCNSQFILDAAGSNFVSMQLSNAYGTTTLGFAASNNNYITGSVAGDFDILNTVPTGRIFLSTNSNFAGLTVNSNDFIGINTPNPMSMLHMYGCNATFTLDAAGSNFVSQTYSNAFGTSTVGIAGSNNHLLTGSLASDFVIANNATTGRILVANSSNGNVALFINSNHFIGLGTSNPASTLAVSGNQSIGTAYSNVAAPANGLIVQGNIGIGTSNPAPLYAADINGTVRINITNTTNNKLLVLLDQGSNDAVASACNFYGFGMMPSALKYQSANSHAFYSLNTEVARITGSSLGIGTSNPVPLYAADINGTVRINSTNTTNNKLLVLYDSGSSSNDAVATACNFYGFGVNGSLFRYQANANASHAFYFANTEAARFTTTSLGIGASSPVGTIHLRNPAAPLSNNIIIEAGKTSDGGNPGYSAIVFNGFTSNGEQRINTAKNRWRIWVDQRSTADAMYFESYNGVGTCNLLTFFNNGRVGINQTNPGYILDVNGTVRAGTTGTATSLLLGNSAESNNNRFISALDSAMTTGTMRYVTFGQSNAVNNQVELGFAYNGNGAASNAFTMGFYGTAKWFTMLAGGTIGLNAATPSNTLTVGGAASIGGAYSNVVAPTNGMIIQGNVGVGLSNPGYQLDVNSTTASNVARFYASNNSNAKVLFGNSNFATSNWSIGMDQNAAFNVYFNGTTGMYMSAGATAWTATSDSNLKTNIEPLTYGLPQVNKLNPVKYHLKTDPTRSNKFLGLIAQDVQKVIPEVVDENETLGIRYTEIIPVLIKAVQELTEENKALKGELAEQKTRLDRLEGRFVAAGL